MSSDIRLPVFITKQSEIETALRCARARPPVRADEPLFTPLQACLAHARSSKTEPTEYPAPNEQISPLSPGARSSEYCENAMIDPADEVLA